MRRPFRGFGSPRYLWRHFIVNRKSPLKYLWWSNVLDREVLSSGMYNTRVASVDFDDCGIVFERGAPSDNHIELTIYDPDNRIVDVIRIPLSYRAMGRILAGFDRALVVGRRSIREWNESVQEEADA